SDFLCEYLQQLSFCNECPQAIFPLWVLISKRIWDSKGMTVPLAQGHPIGARAPCWQRIPKGTAVSPAGSVGASKCLRHFEVATGDPHPLAVVSKGGGAALAGEIQRRAEPSVAGRIQ